MTVLFCLPYAGGDATTLYGSWRAPLAPGTEVVPLDFPGRGRRHREPVAASPEQLVDDVLDAVRRQVRPGEPWAVFGHSMGAMVAHRAAAEASHRTGTTPPRAVFVSGRRPPGDGPVSPVGIGSLDELLANAASWGGIPPDLTARPHLARPLLAGLAHDLSLSHDPVRTPPVLDCPVHVLWSDGDPLTRPDRIGGWALVSRGPVTFHRFAGDHFFIGPTGARALPVVRQVLSSEVAGDPLPGGATTTADGNGPDGGWAPASGQGKVDATGFGRPTAAQTGHRSGPSDSRSLERRRLLARPAPQGGS
ncbi:thioesterase II family protein [Myceligenerans crystallogenes]|uniref:Alpha/beta fold hydrolase n=1 Tax=Myceligenerans crystallogenes TaxID=316335 RepID=A0ABP4ZQK7_9MICO